MSERFAQSDEWGDNPLPDPEPKCGVWNTVAILAGATGIGIVIGLIGWKVFG